MRILVTGGAGYIGSVVVEQLVEAGHQVWVFDNLSRGHRAAVHPGALLIVGDLADKENLASTLAEVRPEAVMHFAALSLVGESMQYPERYFRCNVCYGLNLLEACAGVGVQRLVFSSTAATYGQPRQVPITEDSPTTPNNPYGESKLAFERMMEWFGRIYGITTISLRYFNAAGASLRCGEDHRPETHLIPVALHVAMGKLPHLEIFGTDYPTADGTCIRDFIHVEDLARAHLLALQAPRSATYNLGNGTGFSVRQVADATRLVTGRQVPTVEAPRRPGDPPVLVASSAKISAELGWRPVHTSLEEIIESAWRWYLAHPNGYAD
jgi:UDP-glucose 4-epimerase